MRLPEAAEKAYLFCDRSAVAVVCGTVSTAESAAAVFECRSETRCLMLKNRLLSFAFGATWTSAALDSLSGRIKVDEGDVTVVVAEPSACCSVFSWLAFSWFSFSKYRAEANSVI